MKREINQLKAGTLITYVTMFISTIIPFLYTPIMLRLLGQAEYGLYSLSNSVISYLSLLTLGLGGAITRYIMKYKTAGDKTMLERVAGLFVLIYAVISLITVAVGVGLSLCTETFFSKGLTSEEIEKLRILIIIMSVSVAFSFIPSVYSTIIICYERYIYRKVIDMILTVASPILNLVVLYMGYATIGMALAGLSVQILTTFLYVWYCNKKLDIHPKLKNPPKELLKSIFSFTAFVFIGMIADLLYWATDKVLIGAMLGSVAVAVYNIGATFNSMINMMASAISGVFGPRVNTYVFENRPISELSTLMIRVGRLQYLIISLALSGLAIFGQKFIFYWAGIGYEDAYYVAVLTMVPLVIPLIQNIAFATISAQNKHQFRSILYVVLAVANVVGTYLLIPVIGVIGAALCTCIVYLIGHGFLMNWYYYRKIGINIPLFWKNILRMTIIPVLWGSIYVAIDYYLLANMSSLIDLLVRIIVYTIVFCLLTWFFTMNDYEKNLFKGLANKLVFRRKKS